MIPLLLYIPFFQDNSAGILASVISMICFGFADSLWRGPTQVFGAARTILFRNFFVLLVVLPYYLFTDRRSFISTDAVLATFGISILSYLGLYFFAKATKEGLTSVVVPVSSTNTLFTLLLHIIILDNALINGIAGFGIGLTVLGLIMLKVNWRNGKLDLVLLKESGFRYALLAALFWGVSFGYSWFAVTFVGPALFSLIQEGIILVLAAGHSLILLYMHSSSENRFKRQLGIFEDEHEDETHLPKDDTTATPGSKWKLSRQWKQYSFVIGLIGFLGAIGSLFNTIALDKASINTVTGIVVIAPVISIFFGQLYYGERLSLQQKIAIFFIISGVFVISYFRYY
ncbi:MAG TPA: DMT family transporter [Catalimonadaceae bacterium]|nr:DMT family transporter [Catalimonadaceae bacterium]